VQLACADFTKDNRPGEAQDMFWSPAGDQLLMPTYNDALKAFRDTDIRIFDAATFAVRNLTDDGFQGSILESEEPANLDVLAQWGGEDSIFFVRHSIPAGGYTQGTTTSLMSVATDGSEPKKLLDITSVSSIAVWNFTVSSDASLLAYSIDNKNAENAGIYLLEVGQTEASRIAEMTALADMRLSGLAFSADRKFLLLLGRLEDGNNTAQILDLATGKVIPVDANQNVTGVAWSPTGSTLAYVTYDRAKPDMPGGLFLTPAPGRPARLLIGGAFYPTMCCGDRPIIWATNDTLVLSQLEDHLGSVIYVQLGE
jgi:WD40 repeat protein